MKRSPHHHSVIMAGRPLLAMSLRVAGTAAPSINEARSSMSTLGNLPLLFSSSLQQQQMLPQQRRSFLTLSRALRQQQQQPSSSWAFRCRHCRAHFDKVDKVMMHIESSHPEVDVDNEPMPEKVAVVVPSPQQQRAAASSSVGFSKDPSMPVPPAPRSRGTLTPPSASSSSSSSQPQPTTTGNASSILGGDDYRCEVCGKPHDSEMSLLDHMESDHADVMQGDVDAPPTPPPVSAPSVTKPKGNPKIRVHDGDFPLHHPISVVCLACGVETRTYKTVRLLSEHLLVTHKWDNVVPQAQQMYREYLTHLRDGTEAKFACQHCPRTFLTQEAHDEHSRIKHPPREKAPSGPRTANWWCEQCQKGWKDPKGLFTHNVQKHKWKEQKTPCPICRKKYNDVYAVLEHIQGAHSGMDWKQYAPETYECDHCDKKFIDLDSHEDHVEKAHPKAASKVQSTKGPAFLQQQTQQRQKRF